MAKKKRKKPRKPTSNPIQQQPQSSSAPVSPDKTEKQGKKNGVPSKSIPRKKYQISDNPSQASPTNGFLKEKPFLSALIINGLLFALAYLVYTPFFQTNDDPGMMLEVAGVALSPEPTEYMIFTSVILGKILKSLYSATPSIAWYGYYLVFSLFIGNTALLYVFLRRNPHFFAIILYVIYFMLIEMFTLISLQFTVTGFACGLGGMALIFLLPNTTNKPFTIKGLLNLSSVTGAFLLGLALMIRLEAIALSVALFSPIILIELFRQKKLFLHNILQFGFAIAICIPLFIINKSAYSTPEWKESAEFIPKVGQFVDNHVMHKASEEKRKEAMEKTGWKPIDNAMLSFWFFMDEEIYSIKNFDAALSVLENEMNTDEITKYLEDVVYEQPIVNRAMLIVVFFSVFLFFKPEQSDNPSESKILLGLNIALVIGTFIGLYGLLWAIHYFLKQAPPHVYISSYIFLAILPLLLMTENSSFNPFKGGFDVRQVAGGVLGLLTLYNVSTTHQELKGFSNNAKQNSRNLKQIVQAMQPTEDKLFVVWASSFPYENISPFSDLNFMRKLNLFSLGSIQRTPIAKATLDEFGIDNIYTGIAENPNMYLVVRQDYQKQYNWLGIYNQFMYEHYKKPINPKTVLQAGAVMVVDVNYQSL